MPEAVLRDSASGRLRPSHSARLDLLPLRGHKAPKSDLHTAGANIFRIRTYEKRGRGVGRHVSTSTLTLGGLNVHRHLPNALDDCVHDVPRMNRADAIGGAAQQHVPGQEGIEG